MGCCVVLYKSEESETKSTLISTYLMIASVCVGAACPDFTGIYKGVQDTYGLVQISRDGRIYYEYDHDGYDQATILVGDIDDKWENASFRGRVFVTDYIPRMYCDSNMLVHLKISAATISETRFRLTETGDLSVIDGLYLPGNEFPASSETIYYRERY